MKHIAAYIIGALCFIAAGIVLWPNRMNLTGWHLGFVAGMIVFGAGLWAFADAKEALGLVASGFWKFKNPQPPAP